MHFPPPIRFTAPLLALFFGLIATWFDYRLNLDLDLARHLAEMRERADANGRWLARASEKLLAAGENEALQTNVEAMADLPQVEIAAVVDESGRVLADSTGILRGQPASEGALKMAAALTSPSAQPVIQHGEDVYTLVSAHPFRLKGGQTGWVLLEFDRAEAVAAAEADARAQLHWMASAMALLSFALWAVLHFGFAARIGRLAESVLAFGEGKDSPARLPGGDDETGTLATAFCAMAANVRERAAKQEMLEREVLEISESERQRIGHDLHDGLGQRLTAASMSANALVVAAQKAGSAELAERAEEIGKQLRDAIADTRALAHGLAPVALNADGLMNALAALAQSTTRGGAARCVWECAEPVRVADTEVARNLYRIAQEAVNNALKHARASEIRIGLERRDDTLILEVDDDGRGFDESAASAKGIGLRVMHYRARLIGGSLDLRSAPAGGARVSCRVKLAS